MLLLEKKISDDLAIRELIGGGRGWRVNSLVCHSPHHSFMSYPGSLHFTCLNYIYGSHSVSIGWCCLSGKTLATSHILKQLGGSDILHA